MPDPYPLGLHLPSASAWAPGVRAPMDGVAMNKRAAMLLVLVPLVLAACGVGPTPTASPAVVDPSREQITEARAIELAMLNAMYSMPGATAVDDPRNPIARLMTIDQYWDILGRAPIVVGAGQLIWVVQVEGESELVGPPPAEARRGFSFAFFAFDAGTGTAAGSTRRNGPLFSAE